MSLFTRWLRSVNTWLAFDAGSRRRRRQVAARKWAARCVLGVERLEGRINPGSASPTNVSAIYNAGTHSLSVSFQEAIGSTDTPAYAAVFIEPAEPSATTPGAGIAITGTLISGSNVVTGLSSTSGLFVGESVLGTGIPIPALPSNPTPGTPETITTITAIDPVTSSITLSAKATAGGSQSLTFITGLALDGSGMEFLGNTISTSTIYTQTYTYSSTYQNPYLLTAPSDVCVVMYHNTGGTSGSHSVIGDGPGLNTDNSYVNNNDSDDYQVISSLVDYNTDGKINASDSTPTQAITGTLTNGSKTVSGLSTALTGTTTSGSPTVTFSGPGNTTTNLFIGEAVSGTNILSGTVISAINSPTSLTLSKNATAGGSTSLTFNAAASLYLGEYLSGTGIPAGDTVASVGPATGTITLATAANATSPGGGTSLTFDTLLLGGYQIISGKVDLNRDGTISNADTTSTLSGNPLFNSTVITGTLASGSKSVTLLSSTAGLAIGEYVEGIGIPSGTSITGINQITSTITLSKNATASGLTSLTIGYNVINGEVDLNGDGTINASDSGSLNLEFACADPPAIINSADLQITKVDNEGGSSITGSVGTVVPGTSFTYTIVVTNAGPDAVNGASVTDTLPGTFTNATWTATATGGATGFSAIGSGNINDTSVSMPVGSTVTYTLTGTISASATGTLSNTATVIPPAGIGDLNPSNNTATDTDTLTPQNDVSVTKVDNKGGSSITSSVGTVVPGTSFTYTIVVSNAGPSTATSVGVSDPLPAGIASDSWSGSDGSSGTGTVTDTIASLAPNASVTYTVTATVSPSASAQLVNTVTVTSANDTNTANNTATDKDNLTPQNDVSVTKVDNKGGSSITSSAGTVVPGSNFTYTVVVSNTGPSTATSVGVSDPLPAGIASDSWSGSDGSSGTGTVTDTIASLAPNASVTYTVTATVSPSATAQLLNTVTVTSANDTNTANNTATDKDNLTPQNDVSVTKVDNKGGSSITGGTGAVVPGTTFTYTITVSNAGPSTATSVGVSDPLPAGIASDSWSGSDGSSGTGTVTDTIASLAPNASVTYTVTATVSPSASAQLVNTVTVTSANDTNTANNTATDKDNLTPQNDVSVTKVDNKGGSSITSSVGTVVPGTSLTYTIVVSNTGPSTATSVGVSDPLPAGIASDSWSGSDGSSGTGTVTDTIASLAPNASVTYTVTAAVSASATAQLVNTVTVTSAHDTNSANNTATDKDNLTPQNDVSVTKVDNKGGSSITSSVGTVVPGTSFTYTIVVSNAGPSTATSVGVSDPLPAGIASDSWSGSDGSSGTGTVSDTIASLAPNASVTYTVTATVSASATAQLVNTVTVTSANDTNSANNTATDKDNLTPQNDVSVTKVDNKGGSSITSSVGTVVPGTSFTYTIVVSNAGPSTATSVGVSDPLPAGIASDTWSGSDGSSGSGTVSDSIASLAPNASVTYTVTATVSPSATAQLVNTVTVTAANNTGSNTTATDKDNLTPQNDVGVTKVDNKGGSSITSSVGSVVPGSNFTYTIVVSNSGPSAATSVGVSDPLPAGIASDTWSGSDGSSGSGTVSDTIASLAPNASVTYTVTATVSPSATAQLVNTVTVTAANNTGSNTTATDKDNLTPQNDVGVTKVDNKGGSSITSSVGSVVPGNNFTYTIVVSNSGPSAATSVGVSDTLPPGIASDTWSGSDGSSGSGTVSDTIASLAPNASVTYTVTATVSPSATAQLVNTVTVTAANNTGSNTTATDKDNLTPQNDISVTKVDNKGGSSITSSTGSVVPGTSFTYTIVVSNSGPSTATSVGVSDPLPAGIASDTWSGSDGSSGSGTVSDTIASLAPNASVTYTVTATVSASATAQLVNTVTVTAANNAGSNTTATDKDNLTPQNDVSVTKVDNKGGSSITSSVGTVVPGTSFTYTIVVSNTGPSTATSVAVSDSPPANVTFSSWSGSDGSSGTGTVSDTIASLAPGASVIYTVTASVSSAATGSITNTVTVTAANDTNPNNTASDTDTLTPQPAVEVTKVDNKGGSSITGSTGAVVPGTSFTYTIVVSNTGPSTATSVAVSDSPPAGVTFTSWTGSDGNSGTGAVSDTIASLAPNASVTYTVTASVSASATGFITNTVTATQQGANPDIASDTDTLTPQNDVSVTKVDNKGGSSITGGTGSAVPGTSITYTIVVSNNGPSTATSVGVSDPLPAGIASDTWSGSDGSSGTGTVTDTIASLAPSGSVTYTIVAAIDPAATAQLVNTVTVTSANNTGNNTTATDTDNLTPQNDASVTKVDNKGGSSITPSTGSVVPGTSFTYTIVVSNSGPSTATSVGVSDPLPAGIASDTWSGSDGSSGTGNVTDTIASLAPNASVTYTIVAAIDPAATAQLVNTVTVTSANDTNSANNTATDKDNLTPQNDVSVTKVDNKGGSSITGGTGSAVPGTSITYIIVVSNSGPSTATSVGVSDPLPAGIVSDTWSGSDGSSGTGTVTDTIASLAPNASVTYTIVAAIDPAATAQLVNTVTVTSANNTSSNTTATDKDNLTPQNDVSVTKVDNKGGSSITSSTGSAVPGTSITYTIVVSNSGPSTATSVGVSDPLPAGIASDTWSGSDGSSGTGNVTDTIASLAPNASVTYTIVAAIDPAATAQLVNTVTVTSANDTNSANNTATDKDNLTPQNDVSVTKVDNKGGSSITGGTGSAVPGTSITYIIVVSNSGPSTATSVGVSDPLPAGIVSDTWSGSDGSSGTGTVTDTIASLAPNASVTYTIVAAIDPAATAQLVNTVTVTSANNTSSNTTATDKDNLTPQNDVSVTKVDNKGGSSITSSTGSAVPGTSITYTIVVSNSGHSTATSVGVSDPLPAGIASDTWSGSDGSSGTGNVTDTIASLAPNASVTYTIVAAINPAATAQLVNTVTVTSVNDTNSANNTATDKDNLTPQNDVSVTKVDNKGGSSITGGTGSAVPGTSITYTIVVSNSGPSTATSVGVSDPLPAGIASDTWSGSDGSSGTGNVTDTIASLAPNASVTYTVTAMVSASATAQLVNTVTVSAANNTSTSTSAIDKDNLTPQNDTSVTKVDNKGGSSVTGAIGSVVPGTSFTYTIVVSNSGPSTATSVLVSDTLPPGITSDSWSGSDGSSGSGAISDTIATLAPSASVTYTVTASVGASATAQLVNTVTVSAANNTSTSTSATDKDNLTPQNDTSVTKVDNKGGSSVTGAIGSVVPGTSFTYTIVVSNSGPSTATSVLVSDTLPPGITSDSWSGSDGSSGSGAISDTIATLAPSASVTYTVTASVGASATAQLVNTVTVSAANNTSTSTSATDKDNLTPQNDTSVTKVDNKGGSSVTGAIGSVVPGTSFTYTIVVSNSGPSTATSVLVSDTLPPGITSDSWSGSDGSSGSGAISDTIATLAPNASVTYTVTATVSASATAQLVNTVSVTSANNTSSNTTATDKDNLTPQNDVSVTKVDNKGGSSITSSTGSVVPGTSFTYTITVTNSGPSTATNVSVHDMVPSGITSFLWSGNGRSNVSGAINDTITSLAPNAIVVYTVTANVGASATGTLNNTVTVNAANDTNSENNSATDSDTLDPQNGVGVTKVDNKGGSSITSGTGSVLLGTKITYTIVVNNSGPSTATNVSVSDPVPSGLTSFVWTGNGHTNVSGALIDTILSLAPGARVVYTITATVSAPTLLNLSNTVTVSAANDTNKSSTSATDNDIVRRQTSKPPPPPPPPTKPALPPISKLYFIGGKWLKISEGL